MGLEKQICITPFGLSPMPPMLALHYSSVSQQCQLNANPLPMNSLTEAKLDFVIVLVVSMGCWCGQKNHQESSVWKLVLMMGNSTVEGKENSV